MDLYKKYIKYKKKYMMFKQFGGNFYFAVYTFTKSPLDKETIGKIVNLLFDLYNSDISVITDKPHEDYNWDDVEEFIKSKTYKYEFNNITAFIINDVPGGEKCTRMNDEMLTELEILIKNKFEEYEINKLDLPVLDKGLVSQGWGLSNANTAIITFVEK